MLFHQLLAVASVIPPASAGVVASSNLHLRPRMGLSPAFPHDERTTAYCSFWHDNDGSQSCADLVDSYSITLEEFIRWNPSITPDCENLRVGRSYCTEVENEPAVPISPKPASASPPASTSTATVQPSTTSTTTTTLSNGITTPSPVQPGMVPDCDKFYFVKKGDTCSAVAARSGISLKEFELWNTRVGRTCSGLWAEVYACVSVLGHEPGTPASPSNGIETPQPLQPDIVDVCNKFDYVEPGQSCGSIAARNGITVADLAGWNPRIGSDCSGLWANTYACVGVIKFYDFDDGTSQRWSTIHGTFDFASKAIVAGWSQGGKAVAKAPLSDFIAKVHITLADRWGDAGMILRASDLGNGADSYKGYYVGISAQGNGYVVLGRADNAWRELRRAPVTINAGQTYTVKIIAVADEISVFYRGYDWNASLPDWCSSGQL